MSARRNLLQDRFGHAIRWQWEFLISLFSLQHFSRGNFEGGIKWCSVKAGRGTDKRQDYGKEEETGTRVVVLLWQMWEDVYAICGSAQKAGGRSVACEWDAHIFNDLFTSAALYVAVTLCVLLPRVVNEQHFLYTYLLNLALINMNSAKKKKK